MCLLGLSSSYMIEVAAGINTRSCPQPFRPVACRNRAGVSAPLKPTLRRRTSTLACSRSPSSRKLGDQGMRQLITFVNMRISKCESYQHVRVPFRILYDDQCDDMVNNSEWSCLVVPLFEVELHDCCKGEGSVITRCSWRFFSYNQTSRWVFHQSQMICLQINEMCPTCLVSTWSPT